MGQKTHPIGFRLGIKNINPNFPIYNTIDLHGLTSRWAINLSSSKINTTETYADLTQRDRIIKEIIEQYLEESGYIRNKIIVTRTVSYVGIYVDGLQMEEVSQISTRSQKKELSLENSQKKQEKGCRTLEEFISFYIEEGLPIHIQFVNLLSYTKVSTRHSRCLVKTPINLRGIELDLYNSLKLLIIEKIPCCSLIAKIIAQRRSLRREREALRILNKLITLIYPSQVPSKDVASTVYGLKGYLRVFKGRIGGSERSRILRYRSGPMPRHTVSAAIDHGFAEVRTNSGKVSITIRGYFK